MANSHEIQKNDYDTSRPTASSMACRALIINPYPDICVNIGYPDPGVKRRSVYNPSVPYTVDVDGLRPKTMIYFSGIPNPSAKRFNINFLVGEDVAFHFDVRFQFGNDRKVIVRNNCREGCWGEEERDLPYFPFEPGTFFDMLFLAEPDCFKVAVNDNHLLRYNHRIGSLDSISKITVHGDLHLTKVQFQ